MRIFTFTYAYLYYVNGAVVTPNTLSIDSAAQALSNGIQFNCKFVSCQEIRTIKVRAFYTACRQYSLTLTMIIPDIPDHYPGQNQSW